MLDALGAPQSLLLLGGTSDIALAIAHRYAAERPLRVVLAARPTERRSAAAAELAAVGELGGSVVHHDGGVDLRHEGGGGLQVLGDDAVRVVQAVAFDVVDRGVEVRDDAKEREVEKLR